MVTYKNCLGGKTTKFLLNQRILFQITFTLFFLASGLLWINSKQVAAGIFSPDNAYPEAMYKDLALLENPLNGWQVTKSPQFFPDLIIYFIIRRLTGDFATAYYVCTVLYVLLIVMFLRYMGRNLNPQKRAGMTVFQLQVWTLFFLAVNTKSTWDGPLNMINIYWHNGIIPLGLLTIILLTKYENSIDTKKLNISVLIVSLLATSSDFWWIPWFVLPLTSISIYYSLKLKRERRKLLEFLSSLIMGSVLGYLFNAILKYFMVLHFSEATPGVRGIGVATSLTSIATSFVDLIQESPGFLMLTILSLFFTIMLFTNRMMKVSLELEAPKRFSSSKQKSSRDKARKNQEFRTPLFPSINLTKILFAIVFFSWSFTAAICAIWGLWSGSQFRYFSGPMTLLWITVGVVVAKLLGSESFNKKGVLSGLMVFVLAVSLFVFQQQLRATQGKNFNSTSISYPENISCIDSYTEKYGVRRGIGSYYMAAPTFVSTKNDLIISPIDYNFRILHWLSNYYWGLRDPSSTTPAEINFVIVAPEEPIYESIPGKFGAPDHEFRCGGWNVLFYLGENSLKINSWFSTEMRTFLKSLN